MKLDSLKNSSEFDFIYKNSHRFFHRCFILYGIDILSLESSFSRQCDILHTISLRKCDIYVGLSISRKIAKAHIRNRLKRRVKAILQQQDVSFKGYVFVFVAKAPVVELDFAMLKKNLSYAMAHIQKQPLKPKISKKPSLSILKGHHQ